MPGALYPARCNEWRLYQKFYEWVDYMKLSSELVNQVFLIASMFWCVEKCFELAESIVRWTGDWLISILKKGKKGDSDD